MTLSIASIIRCRIFCMHKLLQEFGIITAIQYFTEQRNSSNNICLENTVLYHPVKGTDNFKYNDTILSVSYGQLTLVRYISMLIYTVFINWLYNNPRKEEKMERYLWFCTICTLHQITSTRQSRVLLHKLITPQLVLKLPAF